MREKTTVGFKKKLLNLLDKSIILLKSSLIGKNMIRTSHRYQTESVIIRRHRPDYFLVMAMILLMLTGLILIYAIGPQRSQLLNNAFGGDKYGELYFFKKQIISLLLALVAFFVVAKAPLKMIRRFSLVTIILSIVLGILLLVFGRVFKTSLAVCALGACRWLNFGLFTIQVSEVMKLACLIFFASFWGFLAENKIFNTKENLTVSLVVIFIIEFFIVVAQSDLGTGLSLAFILLILAFTAGIKMIYFIPMGILGVVLAVAMIFSTPYRLERLMSIGDNHHIVEAKIALGSGGLSGRGIGKSVQASGYLPEAINDSIFPIIGEVFGLIGCLALIGLFTFLFSRLIKGVEYSHNHYYRLLLSGAFAWFFGHFVINIFSMIGYAPITGITLPFLSFGGTSMIFIAAALGLAFNASRFTSHQIFKESK